MEAALQSRRGRVSVKVGVIRAEPVAEAPVPLCLVGLVPTGSPWYADSFPRVRATRSRDEDSAVEHIRLSGREDLSQLPGLTDPLPSRLRDAAGLAVLGGAAWTDILIVRAPGLRPWDLDHPDLPALLEGCMEQMQGSIVVFPDSAGPVSVGPQPAEPPEEAARRLRVALPALAGGWTDRWQLALFDLPGDPASLLNDLPSMDAAVCRWRGSSRRLAAHGWRSAAAVVGAWLARPEVMITQGVQDVRLPVGPGRAISRDRRELLLGEAAADQAVPDDERVLDLWLSEDADRVTVSGESSLRRPSLEWSVPAIRTLKTIHMRLVRAAEAFVFRPVQPLHAFALGVAVEQVLRPFFQLGLLVGPDGVGPPALDATVVSDPAAPGLAVDITGQIRPWCRRVSLRVGVRAVGGATVEVRA